MKLKSYPGHVVDANFSVGKCKSMAVLYEANWNGGSSSHHDKRLQFPHATSESTNSISTLGHYQHRVDQIHAFEANQDRSKYLTLGRPQIVNKGRLLENSEWDCDNGEKKNTQMINPLYNHTQNNWHSSDYLADLDDKHHHLHPDSKKKMQIKRSQTVIVKQPTSAAVKDSNYGTINFKQYFKQVGTSRGRHKAEEMLANGFNDKQSCDNFDEVNALREDVKKLSMGNANANAEKSAPSRMHSYKTIDFHASNEGYGNLQNRNFTNGTMPSKCLLNPLARNRSIKINHFDMINAASSNEQKKIESADGIDADDDGKFYNENENAPKKEKKLSLSRRFYNTISAGSKLPKVFLGRSKSQRTKLDIVEFNEQFEKLSPSSKPEVATKTSSSASSNSSTLSTASPSSIVSDLPKSTAAATTRKRFFTATKQSNPTQKDHSESFFIPRPHLIVPVHSYARKRRTGNLAKDQSMTNAKTPILNGKGNFKTVFTVAYMNNTHLCNYAYKRVSSVHCGNGNYETVTTAAAAAY
jgi:hypothetical protein